MLFTKTCQREECILLKEKAKGQYGGDAMDTVSLLFSSKGCPF